MGVCHLDINPTFINTIFEGKKVVNILIKFTTFWFVVKMLYASPLLFFSAKRKNYRNVIAFYFIVSTFQTIRNA